MLIIIYYYCIKYYLKCLKRYASWIASFSYLMTLNKHNTLLLPSKYYCFLQMDYFSCRCCFLERAAEFQARPDLQIHRLLFTNEILHFFRPEGLVCCHLRPSNRKLSSSQAKTAGLYSLARCAQGSSCILGYSSNDHKFQLRTADFLSPETRLSFAT